VCPVAAGGLVVGLGGAAVPSVYLAAEYVEVYRSGRPGLVLADAGDDGPITLDTLLAAVPRYVVEDLTAMVTRADTGLSQVRAAVSSTDVVPGPTFAGSDAVGHADGDWIARGLLVDVKATVHPDRLVWTVLQVHGHSDGLHVPAAHAEHPQSRLRFPT
jgi:hypothetical protein